MGVCNQIEPLICNMLTQCAGSPSSWANPSSSILRLFPVTMTPSHPAQAPVHRPCHLKGQSSIWTIRSNLYILNYISPHSALISLPNYARRLPMPEYSINVEHTSPHYNVRNKTLLAGPAAPLLPIIVFNRCVTQRYQFCILFINA